MTIDEQPSLPLNSPLGHLGDLDKEKAKDQILEYAWTRGWNPLWTCMELKEQCFELTPESVESEFARLDEKHKRDTTVPDSKLHFGRLRNAPWGFDPRIMRGFKKISDSELKSLFTMSDRFGTYDVFKTLLSDDGDVEIHFNKRSRRTVSISHYHRSFGVYYEGSLIEMDYHNFKCMYYRDYFSTNPRLREKRWLTPNRFDRLGKPDEGPVLQADDLYDLGPVR